MPVNMNTLLVILFYAELVKIIKKTKEIDLPQLHVTVWPTLEGIPHSNRIIGDFFLTFYIDKSLAYFFRLRNA